MYFTSVILDFLSFECQSLKGRDHLTMNFQINTKKTLKLEKKNLWICSSIYRLMVIQISCNFIIV
jgi:hypothetical protein